jgi:HK97 family phage prohead protease
MERRAFAECRVSASDGRTLTGHAIVFNSYSRDMGGFVETIDPAAVDRTLLEALDVRALIDHNQEKLLGRTRAGTLELRKDAKGLAFRVEVDPLVSHAGDLVRMVARGDVTGMSFGFQMIEAPFKRIGEQVVRTVLDMRVSEISVLTGKIPAYPAADDVALRDYVEFVKSEAPKLSYLQRLHRQRLAR